MARPKSDNSRNRVMNIRMNEKEYSMLLDIQSENGLSFSEFVREAIRFYYNFTKQTKQ